MSTEKLSELSKPVGYYRLSEDGVSYYLSSPTEKIDDEVVPLYSQEYVSALLAERDSNQLNYHNAMEELRIERAQRQAADQRIAELEYDLKCVIANNEDCEKTVTRKDAAIDTFITEYDDAQKIIAELEAKLATPVRLPKLSGDEDLAECVFKYVAAIRAAGFTVEGDE